MHNYKLVIFILIFFILILYTTNLVNCSSNSHRGSDICSHWNGRRHFLELGERGELHAFNVSASGIRTIVYNPSSNNNNKQNNNFNKTLNRLDIWYQCNLELVTCAECVIRITFTYTNFSKKCDKPINPLITINGGNNGGNDGNNNLLSSGSSSSSTSSSSTSLRNCLCEQIHFSEPPYDPILSGQNYCGDGKVFRSKTRTLLLKFFYRATNSHIFSLQYFSERNVRIISGSPKQSIVRNYSQIVPQVISTPYFPVPYPRDYSIEHILTCETDNCRVRLDFTDFQLGLTSKMEIFDSNGQMLDSFTGEHFRPPILVSSGKSLLIQFRGNGVTGYGFRIEVTFISEKQLDEKDTIPFTDCGGVVSGMGGAITMMNMIENSTEVRIYDCIWIIKPSSNYMVMKTHVSLRVHTFHGMASKSELVIRQGITSDSQELEAVTWPNKGMSNKNHIVPVLTGFYIRLRGVFGISSRLAIVYSIFNYMNCYIGSEFLCQNNHCISIRLHCDGFDHCGDGSDEPDTCNDEWAQRTANRGWYSHKPNYYFPKNEEYTDLKAATGIFILSSLGVLIVISMWMIVLYRIGIRARNQRDLQNHLQTISELLDRQDDVIPIDEPPVYEAPPDYEEVIKIGMEAQMRVSSTSRQNLHHHHRRRHRDRHARRHHNSSASSRSPSHSPNHTPCGNQSQNNENHLTTENEISGNPNNNLQEVVERFVQGTNTCETSETNSRTNKQQLWRDKSVQTGSISSHTQIPLWCQLPGPSGQQNNSNYSIATITQFEESSTEFKDQSLDVSLSLAITSTSLNESKSQRPQSSAVYSATVPKKSMIVFNTGETYIKERKLRHTFSTPETWLFSSLNTEDNINYGTNLQLDRNSLLSKTSTFCSDLPNDESIATSPTQKSLPLLLNSPTLPTTSSDFQSCKHQNHQFCFSHCEQQQQQSPSTSIKALIPPSITSTSASTSANPNNPIFLNVRNNFAIINDDSNTADDHNEENSSCFGNVNIFIGKKQHQKNIANNNHNNNTNFNNNTNNNNSKIQKRYTRSKSFNQSERKNHGHKITNHRRSSSDNLLLSFFESNHGANN